MEINIEIELNVTAKTISLLMQKAFHARLIGKDNDANRWEEIIAIMTQACRSLAQNKNYEAFETMMDHAFDNCNIMDGIAHDHVKWYSMA